MEKTNLRIAETILKQFGGRRALAMIGSKSAVAFDNGLQIGFKAKSTNRSNKIVITLNDSDLYDMEFWRIKGADMEKIEEIGDVYAEDLGRIFTETTGLYLSL